MLSLLIRLWDFGWRDDCAGLPRNRSELFRVFTGALLAKEGLAERDPRTRKVTGYRAVGQHLIGSLAALAWELQTRRIDESGEAGGDAGVLTSRPRDWVEACFGGPGLKRAADTRLLDVGPQVRFTHQLLQEYFTALGMKERIEHRRLLADELWPEPWERTGWEVATRLLAGLYPEDCTPVIRWLADAQPDVTADCILESGARTPDAAKRALKARWLPRLTDLKRGGA